MFLFMLLIDALQIDNDKLVSALNVLVDNKPLEMRAFNTGATNVSNSCYMNAALQCLSHVHELSTFLVSGQAERSFNSLCYEESESTQHSKSRHSELGKFMCGLVDVVRCLMYPAGTDTRVTDTREFEKMQKSFHEYYGKGEQQGCASYLEYLMEMMAEATNTVKTSMHRNRPDLQVNSNDKEIDILCAFRIKREQRIFHDNSRVTNLCTNVLKRTLICLTCNNKVSIFETAIMICLPHIETGGSDDFRQTLDESFSAYSKQEALTWECDKCKSKQCALSSIEVFSFGKVVVINLVKPQDPTKRKIPVTELTGVSLRGGNEQNSLYDIVATADHLPSGDSSNAGHYIAKGLGTDSEWRVYNDTSVKVCTESDVLSQDTVLLMCVMQDNRLTKEHPSNLMSLRKHGRDKVDMKLGESVWDVWTREVCAHFELLTTVSIFNTHKLQCEKKKIADQFIDSLIDGEGDANFDDEEQLQQLSDEPEQKLSTPTKAKSNVCSENDVTYKEFLKEHFSLLLPEQNTHFSSHERLLHQTVETTKQFGITRVVTGDNCHKNKEPDSNVTFPYSRFRYVSTALLITLV